MGEKNVRVIDNVQEVLDLLKERSLKVENRVRAENLIKRVDKRLDTARAILRKYIDRHLGELYVDMDGKIFRISAHPDDGNVIIEPVHINYRRITAKTD